MLPIRQIGDTRLHQPTPKVDWSLPDIQATIQQQLAVMKDNLYRYGGVGMAANQCAAISHPLQIIIIGTNDETARTQAATRYPLRHIPYETVMINPIIIQYAGEIYYPDTGEGCMSVMGGLRGRVARYSIIIVEYQNTQGATLREQFESFAAHVIQHEVDHLNGIVFLQKILEELDTQQKAQVLQAIDSVISAQNQTTSTIDLPERILVFDRQGVTLILHDDKLLPALQTLNKETLLGLKNCCAVVV